ncbi:MAG TPA: peptidase T [Candidatus Gemmiger stercoravium]|nr:peptidase T [Candidatus Gemmiger stercoravium]
MRAYERFLQYVKVYTTSDPESASHPTTARQLDLGRMLVAQLEELGLKDARLDEYGYVYATLPATPGCEQAAGLGFIAHMDTAPGTSGENVNPQIHENYDGGDVVLPATGAVLKPAEFPFLSEMKGQTLITTDGSTLLGADDKAGVAEIMTMVERLIREGRPHGKICIGFTPDEEVGQGADLFDVDGFGAAYAYTVDGDDVGEISYENFNAAAAAIKIHGLSVHPGSAKNTMRNALSLAMEYHAALPAFECPEHTEGREGFFHLCDLQGDVSEAVFHYIIRDHDADRFAVRKAQMQQVADRLNEKYGAGTVELELTDSYRNMLEKIRPHFHLVENARAAIRAVGLTPVESPIRGGTDGATLSYKGLPCPNLGTGGFNFHGPMECITVEKMDQAVEVLLNLADLYKDRG